METKSFIKGKTSKGGKGLELFLGKMGNLFSSEMEGHITVYIHPCQLMKEKVISQAIPKQERVRKGFCKGSSSSHSVDETEDGNVITFEDDEQDDISDSGNVCNY